MQESKLNNNKVILFCYIVLFVLLELFHSFIGIYFDDYGNASLSYGYDAGVSGMNWTLSDLGSWANWIYFNFSGRIMCGSLLNLLFKIGNGPRLFMALQAGILVLLFFVLYRIVMYYTKQNRNVFIVVILVALFFLMPSDMYRWNLCWASASVLYIWPLLPFFTAIYLQLKLDKEDISKKKRMLYTLVAVVCILFSAFSHEQTGLSIAVYLVAYVICERIYEKKFNVRNIVFAVLGTATYAALFFAPGNWNRLDGNTDFASLSFFEKIITNFKPLMECLFCLSFDIIYLFITFILVYQAYHKWKKEGKKLPLVLAGIALGSIAITIAAFILQISTVFLLFAAIYLVAVFVCLLIYNYERKRSTMSVLLIASAASAFCVLISPTLPLRCFTEWILIIHIVFLVNSCDMWYEDLIKEGRLRQIGRICVVCSYLVICIIASKTFGTLSLGYLFNKAALNQNDALLKEYKGESEIYLYHLQNDFFAPTMPYAEGYEYISYWMKQYYDIPQGVNIVWTKNNIVSEKTKGDFFKDGWFGKDGEMVIKNCGCDHLNLKLYVPKDFGNEQDITITINGKAETYHLQKGDNEFTLDLKYGKKNTIKFSAPGACQLSEEDTRELSFIMSYYFD